MQKAADEEHLVCIWPFDGGFGELMDSLRASFRSMIYVWFSPPDVVPVQDARCLECHSILKPASLSLPFFKK